MVCATGQKDAVANAIEQLGGDAVPFLLDSDGVVTWQVDLEPDEHMHSFYREWLEN